MEHRNVDGEEAAPSQIGKPAKPLERELDLAHTPAQWNVESLQCFFADDAVWRQPVADSGSVSLPRPARRHRWVRAEASTRGDRRAPSAIGRGRGARWRAGPVSQRLTAAPATEGRHQRQATGTSSTSRADRDIGQAAASGLQRPRRADDGITPSEELPESRAVQPARRCEIRWHADPRGRGGAAANNAMCSR